MSRIIVFFQKIKSKLKLFFYCKKVDYVKMSFLDNIIAYSLTFLRVAVYLLIYLGLPILFIIKNSIINEFLDKLFQSHKTNYINELALTIYGLQLTIFSIMIALKHKKIYGMSELKIGMNFSKSGFSINYFILMSNMYLVFYIFCSIFEYDSKKTSFYLLIYSTILLLKYSTWIKKSTAEVYYQYKCSNIKDNLLFRKRGNVLSVLNNKENINYFNEMLEKSNDKELLKIQIYFSDLQRNIFYNVDNDINDEIELFEIYIQKYFKSIKNDAKIFGMVYTFNKIEGILTLLLKNKKYYEFERIFKSILSKYQMLLSSYLFKRRFTPIKQNQIIEKNNKLLLCVYIRNLFILLILNLNIDLLVRFMDKKEKDIKKNIFENSMNEIEDKSSLIREQIKKYEINNSQILNYINESSQVIEAISNAKKEVNSSNGVEN